MMNNSFKRTDLQQSLVILNELHLNAPIVAVALCVAGPSLYLETTTCKEQPSLGS